jgi:hypothetical protein
MQVVGRVDADVSTGIAGTIGDAPRMIPVSVRVQGPTAAEPRTLHCQVAWVPSLFSSLFVSTLAGGLEAEGQAPAELTVHLRATIQFEAEPAIEIDRVFSGESMSGGAGLTSALSNVSNIVARGAHSTLGSVFVESVDAQIRVEARRTSVAIVRVWAEPAELVAGESTAILVEFRPHRAPEQTTVRRYKVQVPAGFAPGEYRVDVHSAVTDFALEQRRRQTLAEPATWKDLLAGLREEAAARTTDLILRLETKEQGVSTSRRDWVDLPPGIASILASDPAASARSMPEVVRQREETPWPLEGSKSLTLRVVRQAARRFGPVPVPEVAR